MSERSPLLLTRRDFLLKSGIFVAATACRPIIEPQPSPELPGIADLDFPLLGDMYLLAGPHYIIHGVDGTRYALDLFSPEKDAKVVAAKYGRVLYAGEVMADGSINNTLHSIVEIDVGEGFTIEYVHVGKIRVKVGDMVHRGDILGEQSMEVPAPYTNAEGVRIEPKSERVHLHFGIKRYGKPIDIDGKSIAGWIIRKGKNPGEGVMSKEEEYHVENYTVTANINLCGPSKESIQRCGGIINYMSYPKGAKSGATR